MFLPLEYTPQYDNYTTRIWLWTELLIALAAMYYIIKSKTLHWKQLAVSLILGAICLLAKYLNGDLITGIQTAFTVAVTFYGGCRLFAQIETEHCFVETGVKNGLKSFLTGAVMAIPFALANTVYFFIAYGQADIGNFIYSAFLALQPAISEEVIFRFFLLAYGYNLLHHKVSKRFFTIYIYMLTIVPHSLIHLPDLFLEAPLSGIVMFLLTAVFFGFPMAYLMKRKNLQTAIGFHWFIDFIRFGAGF